MKPTRLLPLLVGSLAALSTASATDFVKANNTTALNTAGAWQNASVPGTGDVLLWDSTGPTPVNPRTAGLLSAIGGDLSVLGLKVTNVGGTGNVNSSAIGIQNPLSANTITIGAGGIDMANATQALYFEPKVTLSANQNWIATNANTNTSSSGFNNGEDLVFRALTAASSTTANTAFNLGGNTVTTSGTGTINISSGYNVSAGTFNIGNSLFMLTGGDTRAVIVGNTVNLNVATGSILHLQSNSGLITSSAAIGLNGGTLKLVSGNATLLVTVNNSVAVNAPSTLQVGNNVAGGSTLITTAGAGLTLNANLTGSAALAVTNNASTANALIIGGNNSGYSGTLTFGGTAGRITRLTSVNAGSANATWNVGAGLVLQTAGINVSLGVIAGSGTINNSTGAGTITVGSGNFSGDIANGTGTLGLTKIGTGTLALSGANTYTGATLVSQGTLTVTPAQSAATSVTVSDGATFGVSLAAEGTAVTVPSLTLGSATGASLLLATGASGNPTAAPLSTTTLAASGSSALKLTGTALSVGTFPLVNYSSGTGVGNISLILPPRTVGFLTNVPNVSLSATISSIEQVKWKGNNGTTWDADTVGDGSTGTVNWLTTLTNTPTRYLQTANGSDIANFDDSASGSGAVSVNLSTTLTPTGVTVSNPTRPYTFGGSGKLSGAMGLVKSGASSLTLANTTPHDFTGGTTVSEGSLVLGDGITVGAGQIGGTITNNATLVLNRPSDFTFSNTLNGTGTLQKDQGNTVTFAGTTQITATPLQLNAGKLLVTGGGTLSATISGPGQIEFSTGTTLINGTVPNTNTGLTTVSGTGTILQLGNSGGAALGGDVTVTGTARITPTLGTQLSPTATYTLLGSNADSYLTPAGLSAETVANVVVNSSTPGGGGGQLVMKNGFTVTGTATLNSGVLGAASGQSATLNFVNITATNTTDAILRIAGSSGNSALNIGPGGITASGGNIQVKFNTNNFDSVLNLGGDFTATGDVIITNGGYTGINLNIINLQGERTFNIAAATTTTVAPDLGDVGSLVKTGEGTLVLNASCAAAHTGGTTVSAGTLVVNGTIGDVVADGATAVLGGTTASATPTVGNVNVSTGATVSPGNAGLGRLTLANLTLGSAGKVLIEASAPTTRHDGATGTYDALNVTGNLVLDGTFTLAAISGYTPVLGDSLDLWDAATVNATGFNTATDLVLPALGSGLAWDTSAFATTGVVTVVNGNPVAAYVSGPPYNLVGNDALPDADPDADGISNALEYAFQTSPIANNGPEYRGVAATNGSGALTLAYRRPAGGGVPGVTYGVEFKTADLDVGDTGWTTGTLGVNYTENAVPNGDGTETVTITINNPVSGKKFARVLVTY